MSAGSFLSGSRHIGDLTTFVTQAISIPRACITVCACEVKRSGFTCGIWIQQLSSLCREVYFTFAADCTALSSRRHCIALPTIVSAGKPSETKQSGHERFLRAVVGPVGKPVVNARIGLSEQRFLLQFLDGTGDEAQRQAEEED